MSYEDISSQQFSQLATHPVGSEIIPHRLSHIDYSILNGPVGWIHPEILSAIQYTAEYLIRSLNISLWPYTSDFLCSMRS